VDPVLAHPAPDMMMRSPLDVFFVWEGSLPSEAGMIPRAVTKDQAFPHVAVIEIKQAVGRRNSALVPAVFHAFDHAVEQAPG